MIDFCRVNQFNNMWQLIQLAGKIITVTLSQIEFEKHFVFVAKKVWKRKTERLPNHVRMQANEKQ